MGWRVDQAERNVIAPCRMGTSGSNVSLFDRFQNSTPVRNGIIDHPSAVNHFVSLSVVLEIELRVLHLQGKLYTAESHCQSLTRGS